MAFFRNSTVNLLNLHYGMHAVALSGGGAFFTVYLLRAGVPNAGVLAALAGILLGRFLFRPFILRFAIRYGLRALLIGGTLFSALQYLFLPFVHGVSPALFGLVAMSAIGDTVYWSTYHAYFAALGDDEHRGHQLGIREAVAACVGIVSPLAAGWLLVTAGPQIAFGATTLIAMISSLPLFFTPDVRVPAEAPGAFAAARTGALLFFADGWINAGMTFAWAIALFTALAQSFTAYGGALALAALVGAAAGLVLGRFIDGGHGRRMVFIAFGVVALVTTLRAIAVGDPALAVLANALGALAACLATPTMMTAVYTLAKSAPCTFRFHIAAEGGWDLGGASGLLIAALLVHLGAPLWVPILGSLIGVAVNATVLRRYYVGRREGPAAKLADQVG